MSDTPRTDAEFKLEVFFDGVGIVETVLVEFARQLEAKLADKEKQLAEARAEIELLNKGIKIVQSAFKNYKNADANVARITLKKAQILSASCNPDAVNSERAANEILTTEIERKEKLIEQMREALSLILEGAIHDFHYACQHRDNCLCWGCQKKRVNAALAAERGE